jgi:hypothetical protein
MNLSQNLFISLLFLCDKSKLTTFQEFVKKHPSVFKIPLVALQDLELMNELDSMIKELLTQQCGSMKQKVCQFPSCYYIFNASNADRYFC